MLLATNLFRKIGKGESARKITEMLKMRSSIDFRNVAAFDRSKTKQESNSAKQSKFYQSMVVKKKASEGLDLRARRLDIKGGFSAKTIR